MVKVARKIVFRYHIFEFISGFEILNRFFHRFFFKMM